MPIKDKNSLRFLILLVILITKGTIFPTSSFSQMDTARILFYENRIESFPKPIQASILSGLSLVYFNSDSAKSCHYANEILRQYGNSSAKPYLSALSIAHLVLGQHYRQRKSYSLALENLFKAEDYMLNGYKESYLSLVYVEIGNIYLENVDLDNALTYLKHSYERLLTNSKRQNVLKRCLSLLSNLYIHKQVLDSAQIYADMLINNTVKMDKKDLSLAYITKSRIYTLEGNYYTSNIYAQKGFAFIDNTTDISIPFQLYLNMALNYSLLKDDINTLYYMNKAAFYIDNPSIIKNINNHFLTAGNIYGYLGEKDISLDYYKKHIEQSILRIKEKNKLIQKNLQKQYFIHQQNKEIDILQENNLIKEANLRRNRVLLYSLTSLAALLIFTSGIIIYMQREKFRNRRIISAQRAELTRKQYLEELHDAEMKAANGHIQGQEKERERLAKELHDSIGGTLAGIKMELESVLTHNSKNEHLQKITKLVGSTYNEVRAISHNFAIPDLMKGDFQDNLKNLIYNIPGKNGLHIQLSVYQKIYWDEISNHIKIEIYRIVQESIANIIKHAEAKNADIQIVEDEGTLNITIEDDGKGFNLSNFKKGLGIRNIKSRIDLLNGKFDLDSSPNNGTFLYFNIPLITK